MSVLPSSLGTFPPSTTTVSVKIFNAFKAITVPPALFLSAAPGSTANEHAKPLTAPGKSFLIEHPSGKRLVFDLGVRKDLSTASKTWQEMLASGLMSVEHGLDVAETLVAHGIDLKSINAVIWSHPHIDHVGNASTFPSTTTLVVGAGTQAAFRPGYPLNPEAMFPESDFLGRDVIEIAFADDAPIVAGLKSYDYFGDGSFYLLEAPGHCIGHMLGLARTTPSPDASWILMAGDSVHHPALIRPSPHVPLPAALEPLVPAVLSACARDAPFLAPPERGVAIHHDYDAAIKTLEIVLALDARPDVWVLMSHDGSMDADVKGVGEGRMRWLPEEANGWKAEGVKEYLRWKFLEKGNPANKWE